MEKKKMKKFQEESESEPAKQKKKENITTISGICEAYFFYVWIKSC